MNNSKNLTIILLLTLLSFSIIQTSFSQPTLLISGSNFNISLDATIAPSVKTITPSADSSIRSGWPDSNYGSNIYLFIKHYASTTDKGYIKFSLVDIPSEVPISSAKIFLYADTIYSTHTSNIHFCSNDSWTENTITWNNSPGYGSIEDSKVVSSTGWMNWNVKSKVEQEYTGDKIITFVFETEDLNKGADWRSRDGETGTNPYLEITYPSASLGIQDKKNFLLLSVTSGYLNSSINSLTVYDDQGTFRFLSNETLSLKITYDFSNVKVKGDKGNEFRYIDSGSSINIDSGDTVTIEWTTFIEPWLPMMFILGIAGILSILYGGMYGVREMKKHNYRDALIQATIFISVGFSLLIAWLY